MSQENVEVMRRMLEAFNRGDVESVVAEFDEDCEVFEPPEMPDRLASGYRGHVGIRRWMANLREFVHVEFEASNIASGGDVVLAEWTARGLGDASRAPIEWATFAVLHLRDGRIVRGQGFLNRDEALEAAGLRD